MHRGSRYVSRTSARFFRRASVAAIACLAGCEGFDSRASADQIPPDAAATDTMRSSPTLAVPGNGRDEPALALADVRPAVAERRSTSASAAPAATRGLARTASELGRSPVL